MAVAAIIEESPASTSKYSISKPLEVGIDTKLKNKIWANEFIELEALMVHKSKTSNHLKMVENNGAISFVRAKSNNYKFYNIAQWNTAFHKFVAIYCQKFPEECSKLMKYAVTISTLASQASLQAALTYDRTFREWREADPDDLPWEQVNLELYQHALGTALHQKWSGPGQLQSNNFRPYNGSNQFTSPSSYCYQFNNNKGKCPRKSCLYPHVCQYCRGNHHKGLCPSKQRQQQTGSSTKSAVASTQRKAIAPKEDK
ncbi:hypothetical protein FSP39_020049 [Pinctada imbricata]|uniref:C3H1-type domain-containing protein n=1 Tax=Pinctada imbricata TaxID=66713 RepID=A0AA88YFR7_PINIB|nr:hypothetical protein FSP39_020049 [Pinctada imbricata]